MLERGDYRPRARGDGLIVERLPGEMLVYDQAHDTVHCLPDAVAAVFELCDGTRTRSALAALAEERLGRPVGADELDAILNELRSSALLTEKARAEGISRRQAILAGGGLAAASLITTIAAPVPAAAQSPGPGRPGPGDPGAPCQTTPDCDQGLDCQNGQCCIPAFNPNQPPVQCASDGQCCGSATCEFGGPQTGSVCVAPTA